MVITVRERNASETISCPEPYAIAGQSAFCRQDQNLPLVSCIMPTYNRRQLALRSIRYFLCQDYPNKELVIVDSGTDKVMDLIPDDCRIKYIHLGRRFSIGYTRNLAVELSKGMIIALWDDDDWSAANRIGYQIRPLLEGKADVCGTDTGIFFDILKNSFWSCDSKIQSVISYAGCHDGSIVFYRNLWEKYAKFPDISFGEIFAFLRAISGKARIFQLPNSNVFIYIRHGANALKFICGEFINSERWSLMQAPEFLSAEDLQFYQDFRQKWKQSDIAEEC